MDKRKCILCQKTKTNKIACKQCEDWIKTMKAFIVSTKDLFDKRKNPKLSLSVKSIRQNKRIRKEKLETHS